MQCLSSARKLVSCVFFVKISTSNTKKQKFIVNRALSRFDLNIQKAKWQMFLPAFYFGRLSSHSSPSNQHMLLAPHHHRGNLELMRLGTNSRVWATPTAVTAEKVLNKYAKNMVCFEDLLFSLTVSNSSF